MEIRRLMIVGAGTMGAGIAQVAAEKGLEVDLIDQTEDLTTRGLSTIKSFVIRKLKKGRWLMVGEGAGTTLLEQFPNDRSIPVELLFSSRGRIKIIRLLAECGELNISEIARRTQLNHSITRRHLRVLEQAKLVQEKKFGRIRIYRYKIENLRALALRRFIELWEKSE